jgi:hypothetical protein
MTRKFELAASDRRDLVLTAEYTLHPDGTHATLQSSTAAQSSRSPASGSQRQFRTCSDGRWRFARWMQARATAASRRSLR